MFTSGPSPLPNRRHDGVLLASRPRFRACKRSTLLAPRHRNSKIKTSDSLNVYKVRHYVNLIYCRM